ncbi:hypothetical protein HK104_002361, partial [Borealophlyctis nickersoniae]
MANHPQTAVGTLLVPPRSTLAGIAAAAAAVAAAVGDEDATLTPPTASETVTVNE